MRHSWLVSLAARAREAFLIVPHEGHEQCGPLAMVVAKIHVTLSNLRQSVAETVRNPPFDHCDVCLMPAKILQVTEETSQASQRTRRLVTLLKAALDCKGDQQFGTGNHAPKN